MTLTGTSIRPSALALAIGCIFATGHLVYAQGFPWFGDKKVTYKTFKDPAGRFELEYPTRDWNPVPAGGSAIAILSRNDRTASIVVDLSSLAEPLPASEVAINAKIELENLKEQQPNAKEFTSEILDSKAGPASLIRYARVGTNGPERVMRYSVGVGQELYRLDAVAAEASLAKQEPILMYMLMSFKAPATRASSKN